MVEQDLEKCQKMMQNEWSTLRRWRRRSFKTTTYTTTFGLESMHISPMKARICWWMRRFPKIGQGQGWEICKLAGAPDGPRSWTLAGTWKILRVANHPWEQQSQESKVTNGCLSCKPASRSIFWTSNSTTKVYILHHLHLVGLQNKTFSYRPSRSII